MEDFSLSPYGRFAQQGLTFSIPALRCSSIGGSSVLLVGSERLGTSGSYTLAVPKIKLENFKKLIVGGMFIRRLREVVRLVNTRNRG